MVTGTCARHGRVAWGEMRCGHMCLEWEAGARWDEVRARVPEMGGWRAAGCCVGICALTRR